MITFLIELAAKGGSRGEFRHAGANTKRGRPRRLLCQEQNPAKKFSFPFRRKNRRAQIKKCEENFLAGWRALASGGGAASLVGSLLKECSNFVQKTPPVGKYLCWRALERGDEPTEAFPNWRRGRDSNPRGAYAPTGLANPGTRPLCDLSKNALFSIYFQKPFGGGEIRTHGRLTTTPVFKTGALNRYATPPSQD